MTAGSLLTYTITVANDGPADAAGVEWTDTLPNATTFVSLSDPGGWTCTTPAIGAGGTVTCSADADLPASTNALFALTLRIDDGVAPGTVITNTAAVTSTTADSDSGDQEDSEDVTVGALADLDLFFYTVVPCRVLDTRGGGALGDGATLAVPIEGVCGIPAEARAVAINLTAVAATGNGSVAANADAVVELLGDVVTPATAGRSRANNGVVRLDGDGNAQLLVDLDGGTVHAVIDVVGYFSEVVPVDQAATEDGVGGR